MRFKKLRITVAVAIISFILVAGSIVFLGKVVIKDPAAGKLAGATQILADPKTMQPPNPAAEAKFPHEVVSRQSASTVASTISQPVSVSITPYDGESGTQTTTLTTIVSRKTTVTTTLTKTASVTTTSITTTAPVIFYPQIRTRAS